MAVQRFHVIAGTSGAVALAGATITFVGFADAGALFGIGLAVFLTAGLGLAVAAVGMFVADRPKSVEDAYNTGYEMGESAGFVDGRRSVRPTVVPFKTRCEHCGQITSCVVIPAKSA